jgi:hypothetical protein
MVPGTRCSVVPGNVSYICVNCVIGYAEQVLYTSDHRLCSHTLAPAYSDTTRYKFSECGTFVNEDICNERLKHVLEGTHFLFNI